MAVIYDTIGAAYSLGRRSDPRIASVIDKALEGCASVLNVGAGAGSYESRHCNIVAVEPSRIMIVQRAVNTAPVVQARAEALPFADRSFDAVLGVQADVQSGAWAERHAAIKDRNALDLGYRIVIGAAARAL